MNLHDVYSLATYLPGSWLLNKSRLDSAIEHVAYEKTKRAAGNALYNMIQEGLKNDPDYKEDLYKANVQHVLQQLEDDPEINEAILKAKEVEKRFAEHPYDDSTLAEPGADVYWYNNTDNTVDYDTAVQAQKDGKTVEWYSTRDDTWSTCDPKTSELVMTRDIGAPLRIKDSMLKNIVKGIKATDFNSEED